MQLLQQMLQIGQLTDFICDLIQIRNEEVEEKAQWDFYLHKVHGMSFADFVKENQPAEPEEADMNKVETTVKNSMAILDSFNLD